MNDDDKKLYPNLYADGPYPNLYPATPPAPLAPAPTAPPLGHQPRPAPGTASHAVPLIHASKPGHGNRTICGLMDGAYTVHRTEIGKVTCPECKSRLR